MKYLLFVSFFFFTIACNSEESTKNNFTLSLDKQYVLQEEDNQLITDIAKFKAFENGTISIVSSKDGSCKLYDTTGKLLWQYIPDWKLIDTFLAVITHDHDLVRMGFDILNSERLIKQQYELHGDIDENVWTRFIKSYKHSIETFIYNPALNSYSACVKLQIIAIDSSSGESKYIQAYSPLIIIFDEDLKSNDYIPLVNYSIDSIRYVKMSTEITTSSDELNNLLIYMHTFPSYHPIYSKEDPKNIKFYTIAEIDKNSNEKSYGAILPNKNIKYKVFQNFSYPQMIVDDNKELWYVFPINDTIYNYHTLYQFPLQFEVNNDEFYVNFSSVNDYLTKAKMLNFTIENISVTKDNNLLVYTRFPKRDGNKHSATNLIQVYEKKGILKKQFRYNMEYFPNKQVHGVAANPFNESEVLVVTGDDDNYYLNYCKWVEVK
ncbi:MAG: hypothetical protein KGZ71_00260 [Desulfobulbaceae bacterium]|nr:hypothetical protein [Desulfobulbaceae bacterium]